LVDVYHVKTRFQCNRVKMWLLEHRRAIQPIRFFVLVSGLSYSLFSLQGKTYVRAAFFVWTLVVIGINLPVAKPEQ
jgi:hypothetical protein